MTDDANSLKQRFEDVKNRAQFARDFKVPGGASMIYQHINALKPISLEAAISYATGFKCNLEEISAERAREIIDAQKLVGSKAQQEVREPASIYEFQSDTARKISEIVTRLNPQRQEEVLAFSIEREMLQNVEPQNSTKRAGK